MSLRILILLITCINRYSFYVYSFHKSYCHLESHRSIQYIKLSAENDNNYSKESNSQIARLKAMAAQLRAEAAELEAEQKKKDTESLMGIFQSYDTNSDGSISLDELKNVDIEII